MDPRQSHFLAIRHGEQWLNGDETHPERDIDGMTAATIPPDAPRDIRSPLTALGAEQVARTGDVLAERLYHIPGSQIRTLTTGFKRARDSAEIIVARINTNRANDDRVAPARVEDDLGENGLGLTDPGLIVDQRLSLQQRMTLGQYFDRYWTARRSDPQAKMSQVPLPRLSARAREIAEALVGLGELTRNLDGSIPRVALTGESFEMVQSRVRSRLNDLQTELIEPGATLLVAHSGVIHTIRGIVLREPKEWTGSRMHDPNWDIPNGSVTTFRYDPREGWVLEVWAENTGNA